MTLVENNPPTFAEIDETEASRELARLVEEAKNSPPEPANDAPPPAPQVVDKRSPDQRLAEFVRDLGILQARDRVALVPTQRWFPDGSTRMSVEPFTFDPRPNEQKAPPKGKQH